MLVVTLTISAKTKATSSYYWLLRIMPNLSTSVLGLARINAHQSTVTGSTASEIYFYYLNQQVSKYFLLPPQSDSTKINWNINSLMRLNWADQPQRQVVLSDNFATMPTHVRNYIPLANFLNITPWRLIYHGLCSLLGITPSLSTMPLSIQSSITTQCTLATNGLQILPPSETSPLFAPLIQTVFVGRMLFNIEPMADTPLRRALLNNHAHEKSCRDRMLESCESLETVSSLIRVLINEYELQVLENEVYMVPSSGSIIMLSPPYDSALALVPHEVMIKKGLIPDANYENKDHINPDRWMK